MSYPSCGAHSLKGPPITSRGPYPGMYRGESKFSPPLPYPSPSGVWCVKGTAGVSVLTQAFYGHAPARPSGVPLHARALSLPAPALLL
ncbi:hypothetical protein HaLaN_25734, partial [Haematococcus lacustris]